MKRVHLARWSAGASAVLIAFSGCSSRSCSCSREEEPQQVEFETRAAELEQAPPAKQGAGRHRKKGGGRAAQAGIQLAASHILISYRGAVRAPRTITRTKAEASVRAREAYDKIQATSDFAGVAREYSDDPYRTRGGDLGTFPAKRAPLPFVKGLMALQIDQLSEPIESPYGYHIVLRRAPDSPPPKSSGQGAAGPAVGGAAHFRHITVMHKDSPGKPIYVTRTKEDARKLIGEIAAKLKSGKADFAALARQYSDGPGRENGGDVGVVPFKRLGPKYAGLAAALGPNEISGVLESPFGYSLIQRLP